MSTTEIPVRTIRAELATKENSAAFGELLTQSGPPLAHVYDDALDVFDAGLLRTTRPVTEIEYVWSTYHHDRGRRVLYLERHMEITQTFIPLGNPLIAIMARPDARLDNGMPALDEIKAFVIPPTAAFNMHFGTWHEIPMPIVPGTNSLLTSSAAVTHGWAELDETKEITAGDVEKREVTERLGVDLRVDVPDEVLRAVGLA